MKRDGVFGTVNKTSFSDTASRMVGGPRGLLNYHGRAKRGSRTNDSLGGWYGAREKCPVLMRAMT